MTANSEIEMTMNATLKIITDIEKYGHGLETEKSSNGSRKNSLLNSNSNDAAERSVLERLAYSPDGNGSSNVEEMEKSNRRASSINAISGSSQILQQLEQLIQSDEWINKEAKDHTESSQPSEIPKNSCLSELDRTLVISSSLKSYINLLGTHHRQCIASWLYGSMSQTFSTLFRTPNNNLYCSEYNFSSSNSFKAGIGYAVRLALYDTYGPDYYTKGWRVFVEMGPPVVYISPALHIDLTSYLSTEYLIGDVIVLKKSDGDFADIEGRIDHVAFEKQLDDDIGAGKKPLVVIGVVGSSVLGQNDIISRLLEIRKCKTHFWIHVVGQGLAALCMKEPSEMLVQVLSQVDSFTAPLASWLGILAAPDITIHRSVNNYKPLYHEKLAALPWWVAYHYLTNSRITGIIENAYFLSKVMLRGLIAFPQIEIVGVENPIEFANHVYKGTYTPPVVLIFKYKCPELEKKKIIKAINGSSLETATNNYVNSSDANNTSINDASATLDDDVDKLAEYADSLNFWLSQGPILNCHQLGLQTVTVGDSHHKAFRFCPLESSALDQFLLCKFVSLFKFFTIDVFSLNCTHVDHVHKFIKQLSDALAIIESTISARKRFKEIVSKYPSLGLTPVCKWAGVGAVCYIPSIVKETPMNEWNEKQRQQVSHLNLELVHSLRFVDTAFSSGESPVYDVSCVKFGMLSDDKDLTNLVHLVAERGKEIEQSQKYMDSLAEMIRQGIEAANKDLKRENDARLMQEGMMRQIPLMSSLVNWFLPLDKDLQNIKGRSFDLKTGQIQSTEVFYKHQFMNRTDAISQDPHYTVAKISSGSTKKQNNVNSNTDAVQNNDITKGNAKENDSGSNGGT